MRIKKLLTDIGLDPTFLDEMLNQWNPLRNRGKERKRQEIERLTEGILADEKAFSFYQETTKRFKKFPHQTSGFHIQAIEKASIEKISQRMARNIYYLIVHDSMVEKGIQSDYLLWIKTELGLRPEGGFADELSYGFGRFGREVTNPIPVQGIVSEVSYLNRLVDQSGKSYSWKKVGKTKTPHLNHFIDVFEGVVRDGDRKLRLHLYPLHRKTSRKAPEGFQLLSA